MTTFPDRDHRVDRCISGASDARAPDDPGVSMRDEPIETARFEVVEAPPTIVCHGELDVATVPELDRDLRDITERNPGVTVRVNLADVTFIDSSGLGVLVSALKRARDQGGTVVVDHVEGAPRKVFEITGLLEPFAID
jgi:anti-sigma B factor antagonist